MNSRERNIVLLFGSLALGLGIASRLCTGPVLASEAVPGGGIAPAKSAPGLQKIAPGEYQCFFIVDGRVWAIGSNRAGEMGIGFGSPYPGVPAIEVPFPADVKLIDVAAGGYHGLAADSAGHVWTWGSNSFGQKGDGSPLDRQGVPFPEAHGFPGKIVADSAGKDFGGVIQVFGTLCDDLALKSDGTVWVWGKNDAEACGIVGNGDTATALIDRPTQVLFEAGVSIVQAAMSTNIAMARDSRGNVWSWGGGKDSKTNRGSDSDDFSRPHRVVGLPPIKAIAVGDGFSYGLDREGSLWGWGIEGTFLGLGPATGGWIPQPTARKLAFPEFGSRKVTLVAVSGHSTHVILDDGSLWGWGDSAMGEVGNGDILDFSKHNYCWDWGKYEKMVFRPVRIVPGVSNFKAVCSNSLCFYSYAVTADGKLYSWGRNKTGILGSDVLPTGNASEHPNSWDVAVAAEVSPFTVKTARPVPSRP